MAGLASALAARGVPTTYVAERTLSAERKALGWEVPPLGGVELAFTPNERSVLQLVAKAPADSVHICQGLRANGMVRVAQNSLSSRGLEQWVVMESVDDSGWKGRTRRALYRLHLYTDRMRTKGFLATGTDTPAWLIARGAPADQVFPYAYFLSDPAPASPTSEPSDHPYRFVFIGQFIERKRLDLLIHALEQIGEVPFELVVAGSGPLEEALRALAVRTLGTRVRWLGSQARSAVPEIIASADCLVLPSRFDGWGAVACEALIVGTQVVCSDACGCREVVRQGGGEVFAQGDVADLAAKLAARLDRGRPDPVARAALVRWSQCLSGEAGAAYLQDILAFSAGDLPDRPKAPWMTPVREDGHEAR